MERVTGIEPVSQPWEGRILPLNDTRLLRIASQLAAKLYHTYLALLNFKLSKASLMTTLLVHLY